MKARSARAISRPTASTCWLPVGPTTATILGFEVNCWVTVTACAGPMMSPWTSVMFVLLARLSDVSASSAKCSCSCPTTAVGPVSGPSMAIVATHEVVAALALLVLALLVALLLLLQPAATSAPIAVKAVITRLSMGAPPFPGGYHYLGQESGLMKRCAARPGKGKRF